MYDVFDQFSCAGCRRNNELQFNLEPDDTSNFVRLHLMMPTEKIAPYANIGNVVSLLSNKKRDFFK